jgi:hypothetical protein
VHEAESESEDGSSARESLNFRFLSGGIFALPRFVFRISYRCTGIGITTEIGEKRFGVQELRSHAKISEICIKLESAASEMPFRVTPPERWQRYGVDFVIFAAENSANIAH